jgi:hypothetical protein
MNSDMKDKIRYGESRDRDGARMMRMYKMMNREGDNMRME